MFVSRVFSRVSRSSLNQYCRGISFSSSRNQLPQIFTSDSLLVSGQSTNKWVPCQVNAMHNMFTNASQQFWYSSSAASTQPADEKKNSQEETNNISKEAETKVDDAAARVSSVVKDSFAKIDDSSKDAAGAVPLLKDTARSRTKMFYCTWKEENGSAINKIMQWSSESM